jgi:CHAT domain-containing protein
MTAETRGAKAVISSLWSVNDASTGKLMGDFYKRWADGAGKVAKVEALRQAQLDLLLGTAIVQGDGSKRGLVADKSDDKSPTSYAHPYYWAPFVLMGNWK